MDGQAAEGVVLTKATSPPTSRRPKGCASMGCQARPPLREAGSARRIERADFWQKAIDQQTKPRHQIDCVAGE
jgi:hypothetical protein